MIWRLLLIKNKYLYAFLGVLSYYGSMLLVGVSYMLIMEFQEPGYLDSLDSTLHIDLLLIPIGIFCVWLFYKYLKKKWSTKQSDNSFDLLDDDF